jgi:RTX calcium-binding nonapeptide repeat (4 copies)/Thrombospondin type 3 repeat
VEHIVELTPLESRLVEYAAAGEELDCAPTGATTAQLDQIDDWEERKIRAEVLVGLCTGEVPDWSVHPRRGLRLRGAYITGQVDLSRAQMTQCPLAFHTCAFEEGVELGQATTTDSAASAAGRGGGERRVINVVGYRGIGELFGYVRRGDVMRRLITMSVLVALLVASLATAALAKDIKGTNDDDVLRGTNKADAISARKGFDKVFGRVGADVVRGNKQGDVVHGGDGPDKVYGGLGEDDLYGNSGNDRLYAKDGIQDYVNCGNGRDRAFVGAKDTVRRCEIVNGKVVNPPPPPPPPPPEDPDRDEDGVPDNEDNCPGVPNADQDDLDKDGMGNACDGDIDGDGVANGPDDFPYDPTRTHAGGSQPGDDKDNDGVPNQDDNCVNDANATQENTDKDFKKFVLDTDPNTEGNQSTGTPGVVADGDNLGDACDPDDDNDGFADANDAAKNNPEIH